MHAIHRWDYEPSVFAERLATCVEAGLEPPRAIYTACVHRSCSKCVAESDFDVLMGLMMPETESTVYYGIGGLEECKNYETDEGKKAVMNIRMELMDTCISSVLWDKDEATAAIALIGAFVKANLLPPQLPVLQAMFTCLQWKELKGEGKSFIDISASRNTLRSSDKIARQFCNLPLGAKAIAQIDSHAALMKQHLVLHQMLLAIKHFATSGPVSQMLRNGTTSLQPLLRIQSELASITSMGGDEFKAEFLTDVKSVQEYVDNGIHLMMKDMLHAFCLYDVMFLFYLAIYLSRIRSTYPSI